MSGIESSNGKPPDDERIANLEARLDISQKQIEVAALGHRMNTAMLRKLLAEQFGDSEPSPTGTTAEGKLAKSDASPKRMLGRKMFALRTILGMTQAELAQALRVNRTTVINYEDPASSGKIRGTIEVVLNYYIENHPNKDELKVKLNEVLR